MFFLVVGGFFVSGIAKWLAGKTLPKMTCYVLSGTLNSTHWLAKILLLTSFHRHWICHCQCVLIIFIYKCYGASIINSLFGKEINIVWFLSQRYVLLSPVSTTRVDGWPVSITRQHGPSTRVVETGLKTCVVILQWARMHLLYWIQAVCIQLLEVSHILSKQLFM